MKKQLVAVAIAALLATGNNAYACKNVNINLASVEELDDALDRVGPKKAEAIFQHRAQHGNFSKPEEIMNVSGIGQKTYDLNAACIQVEVQEEAKPEEVAPTDNQE